MKYLGNKGVLRLLYPQLLPWLDIEGWQQLVKTHCTGLHSTYIHMHDVSCVMAVPSIFPCHPSERVTSAVTAAASPDMCAVVYTWDTSRCAAQQCANMKRHIRVIGALPARVAQHNQRLCASREQLFRSGEVGGRRGGREGGNQGAGFTVNSTVNKPRTL